MTTRDIALILPADAEQPPVWLTFADGRRLTQAISPPAGLENEEERRTLLLLPAHMAVLRRFDLPGHPPAQGAAIARNMAAQASIGGVGAVYALSLPRDQEDGHHAVLTVGIAGMEQALARAAELGLDPDIVVPGPLLLPVAEEDWTAGGIAVQGYVRGPALLDADDPVTAGLVGDQPVHAVDEQAMIAALAAAFDNPPVNLRTGPFARRRRHAFDPARLRRAAMLVGAILLVTLAIGLLTIARYRWDERALDAQAVALARPLLPQANDAVLAEEELNAMLARKGIGRNDFTGIMAGLTAAMQANPAVSVTLVSRDPDGLVHATLAAPRAEDINAVLIALQGAGFAVTATSSADSSGRVLAEITVRA